MKLLVEMTLTPKQAKRVDKWSKPRGYLSFSNKAFGGPPKTHHTTFIPLPPPESKHEPEVSKHLGKLGFKVHDYHAGIAKDKHGRDVKIGKVLNRAGHHELLTKFNSDPARAQQSAHKDHVIAITRHPYHVAGMSSDDHPWAKKHPEDSGSCLSFTHGCNRRYLPNEVKTGTHVAYLVHKDDKEIRNPVARVALKPYRKTYRFVKGEAVPLKGWRDKTSAVFPDTQIFGNAPSSFRKGVKAWADHHFGGKKSTSTFHVHYDSYDNGQPRDVTPKGVANRVAKSILKHGNIDSSHARGIFRDAVSKSTSLTRRALKAGGALADEASNHGKVSHGIAISLLKKHLKGVFSNDGTASAARDRLDTEKHLKNLATNRSIAKKTYIKLASHGFHSNDSPHHSGFDLLHKLSPASSGFQAAVSNTNNENMPREQRAKEFMKLYRSSKLTPEMKGIKDIPVSTLRKASRDFRRNRMKATSAASFIPVSHLIKHIKQYKTVHGIGSLFRDDPKDANKLHHALAQHAPQALVYHAGRYSQVDSMQHLAVKPEHLVKAIKQMGKREMTPGSGVSVGTSRVYTHIINHPSFNADVAKALVKHLPYEAQLAARSNRLNPDAASVLKHVDSDKLLARHRLLVRQASQ